MSTISRTLVTLAAGTAGALALWAAGSPENGWLAFTAAGLAGSGDAGLCRRRRA